MLLADGDMAGLMIYASPCMMSNIVHNPQGSCLSSDLSQRSLHLLPVADPGDAGADEEGAG